MRTISIDALNKLFSQIISKLQQEGLSEITIHDDLYRFIPTDEWGRFDEDIILTGSLYDDIDCLNLLTNDPKRIMTYVDFDRISSVLRAVSEELNSARD